MLLNFPDNWLFHTLRQGDMLPAWIDSILSNQADQTAGWNSGFLENLREQSVLGGETSAWPISPRANMNLPCPLRSMAYQMDSTYPMEADFTKNEEKFQTQRPPRDITRMNRSRS